MARYLFCCLLLFTGIDITAQDTAALAGAVQEVNVVREEHEPLPFDNGHYYFLSSKEFLLAVSVLFCLLFLVCYEMWLIRKKNFSEDNAIKLVVITLVIMGSLFLIMAGYDDRIGAPAFALFGTVAGYLFGRAEKNNKNDSDK